MTSRSVFMYDMLGFDTVDAPARWLVAMSDATEPLRTSPLDEMDELRAETGGRWRLALGIGRVGDEGVEDDDDLGWVRGECW
jgi:hypothetical protein